MVRKLGYPVGVDEELRLRKLKEAGFADMAKLPELDTLCKEARSHFGTEVAAVTLLTEGLQVIKARAGIDATETPRGIAFCNYTILEDAVFVVLDASVDPQFSQHPMVANPTLIRFYAGAPLTYLAGLRLGAFCLVDSAPREEFTVGDRAELVDYAERAVQLLVAKLGAVV